MRGVVAVDVGSSAARAGVFDAAGRMLGSASQGFEVHRPEPDHAEHDALQIWAAVSQAVRVALTAARAHANDIAGLAFDATCSLVVLDANGTPVTASANGEDRWNVVMWADHRATAEADEINATGHRVLDFVGGRMSPEMELPKLLWLKRHLPDAWARYGRAFDLADWLGFQATGSAVVSACTVTCKWGYLNHEREGWPEDLLRTIGLADLRSHLRLPAHATALGGSAGTLSAAAAQDLGLNSGTPVGVGLIDAHAGALGVLGATPDDALDAQLALIAGTSNCHMALSRQARPVPGVWGPYFGAVRPDLWLNEGGQSATGALLDHLLDAHAAARALGADRHAEMAAYLERRRAENGPGYASELLVVPDFHGNRSPLADPTLRGVVHGLDLDASFEGLARLYHAAAVGIAYGTRHIVDALNAHGYVIDTLHLTGGHAKSALLTRLYADATGCAVVLPRESDGVLLGTALAAASAGGVHAGLREAGAAMVHTGARLEPAPGSAALHARGYRRLRRAIEQRGELLAIE